MTYVKTKDNRFGANGLWYHRDADNGCWVSQSGKARITDDELKILQEYSGKPVSDYPSGVIQLSAREVNASNQVSSQKRWLYQIHFERSGDKFHLDTGNMMGVVRLRSSDLRPEIQLEISSRFDEGDGQQFLRHLLGVGLGVDITEEVGGDKSDGWDFLLAYLFMHHLGSVLSVGLLKQYRAYQLNDFNPRGHIDISRHIRQNWPVLHGVTYTKTESAFDIPVNHLLRHAAVEISRKWPDILIQLPDANEMLKALRENTPSWSANQAVAILQNSECQTPVHHPYFAEFYEPLRCLARLVLQGENASVYGSEDTVSGVLFNGADLWEEYLNLLLFRLHENGASFFAGGEFNHANNRTKSSPIYLYRPRSRGTGRQRIYPDFRWRFSGVGRGKYEWDCILDAKYKGLVKESDGGECVPGVSLVDRCEMAQYVMATKARLCVLMCPMKESEYSDVVREATSCVEGDFRVKMQGCEWYEDGIFYGHESKVIVIPMTIPNSSDVEESMKSYREKILSCEDQFVKTVDAALSSTFCNGENGVEVK